jgi:hypothetical protein
MALNIAELQAQLDARKAAWADEEKAAAEEIVILYPAHTIGSRDRQHRKVKRAIAAAEKAKRSKAMRAKRPVVMERTKPPRRRAQPLVPSVVSDRELFVARTFAPRAASTLSFDDWREQA